jgi:hypothetical protein
VSDTWYCITLTYNLHDAKADFSFYVNDLFISTNSFSANPLKGASRTLGFWLGGGFHGDRGYQVAQGQFENLETFNYQLSTNEISQHFTANTPVIPPCCLRVITNF